MTISVGSSTTIVNTTVTQTANYSLDHTAGSNANKCYVFVILGMKSLGSNDLAIDQITVSVNSNPIPFSNMTLNQSLAIPRFCAITYLTSPPTGLNNILITSVTSFRSFTAYLIEVNDVNTADPIGTVDSGFVGSPLTTHTTSFDLGVAAPSLVIGGLINDSVNPGGAEFTVTTGSILAQGDTGATAANDHSWVVVAKNETAATTSFVYNWTTGNRSTSIGYMLNENVVSSINKTRTGASTPSNFYVGTGTVSKMYMGNVEVLT